MKASPVEQAALEYLERGWSVIPLRPQDKRPATRWQEYQSRRADRAQVRNWLRRWPDANIGVVTGIVSGLIVVDVDPKHGGDQSLARLEQTHGPLPRTVEAVTGGGGHHLYFSHPGGLIHNMVGLAPGIDLRGDGGYVVAPPSLHASGRCYSWVVGCEPQSMPLAALPGWLLGEVAGAALRASHPLSHWRRLVREGVVQGERNNSIASLAGHLLWHGVDPDVVLELLLCWNAQRCRPPLPEEEVLRTVESITRLHEQRDAAGDEAPR